MNTKIYHQHKMLRHMISHCKPTVYFSIGVVFFVKKITCGSAVHVDGRSMLVCSHFSPLVIHPFSQLSSSTLINTSYIAILKEIWKL